MEKGRTFRPNGMYSSEKALDGVKETARKLSMDIVYYTAVTDINKNTRDNAKPKRTIFDYDSPEVPYQTLRRTVSEITSRHEIVYSSIVKKLELTRENMESVFLNVVSEIFKDKQYNWGRIVSVYAFGARLAKHAVENNISDSDVDFIGEFLGQYVAEKLGWWIEANGGWNAFVDYFPEPIETKMEQNIWRGLLCTAGVGLAALAAVVVVR